MTEASIAGLEDRVVYVRPLDHIASVTHSFLSRIDIDEMTHQPEPKGAAKFLASFAELISALRKRRATALAM